MSGKDNMAAVGHFIEFLDKNRAFGFQAVNDVPVVDDLMADIDRRAMLFECEFDDLDGSINARAKPARGSEQQFHRAAGGVLFSHAQCPLGNVAAPAKAFPLLRVVHRGDKDQAEIRAGDPEQKILKDHPL
jgi:hypothetical protein